MKHALILIALGICGPLSAQIRLAQIAPTGHNGCMVVLVGTTFSCVPIPQAPTQAQSARLYNVAATPNAANPAVWTLPSAPEPSSAVCWRNGIKLRQHTPNANVALSGAQLTFPVALDASESVKCEYTPTATAARDIGPPPDPAPGRAAVVEAAQVQTQNGKGGIRIWQAAALKPDQIGMKCGSIDAPITICAEPLSRESCIDSGKRVASQSAYCLLPREIK